MSGLIYVIGGIIVTLSFLLITAAICVSIAKSSSVIAEEENN